ncbi:GNAT family N-acetyltransferase [Helcobacillus massiliensis]|uniref:bifunctional acetate--CoA ligase family protein/GNAT family N-acetyltransferase n=1 Tax=Helcobacillus massiliensis TaxID=521392 RepID=UPI0021A846D6|nr:GNAT family N-acetyltransferase [Helcobacillus massiliensis]MCT1556930.1 GNAT family N-acetyltransferase [Helcobacillus massiliensis]MCT2035319.1 GNAT family N-acetyltransferase [Helcobacillus massiliensis]MCT2331466.1 GNAT family N-acetyltransferase [Helcobacillus massiliensis]
MALGRLRGSARRRQPAYPAHWEADIPLRDGSAAHLRPITPGDADALQTFHRGQSERSRYFRFFAAKPELSPSDLETFTQVDNVNRVAFIVEISGALVAVARYDRVGPTEAEVAFNVADSLQGRGLGSILLEHLAAAALENGITTFVAEVLPQNKQMLSVFADAGFDVRRTYDDGVFQVDFAITPTARSVEVIAERERRAEARTTERLLHPASIMVVGASRERDRIGARVIRAILDSGFDGPVHPVNPEAWEIAGLRAYARVRDVPGPVDLAVLAISPEKCIRIVPDLAAAGVQGIVVLSGGFADAAERGRELQRELVATVRAHGLRLLGPATLGFFRNGGENPLNVSLIPRTGQAGAVALAAQSSALSAMVLAAADERGVRLHEFVSAGNRADLSLNDTLQHWEDDASVDLIAVALESVGNPRKFTRIASRIAQVKPLLVLRPPGVDDQAPPGHQVRPSALPRAALDQLLEAAGVIQAKTVDHLMDMVDVFAREGTVNGTRIGLLSNSPGLGAALRGAAEDLGLSIAHENLRVPVGADRRLIPRAFTSMAGPGHADIIVVGILDPMVGDLLEVAREIEVLARNSAVQVVMVVVAPEERMRPLREAAAESASMPPVFSIPSRAMGAVWGLVRFAQRRITVLDGVDRVDGTDAAAARAVITRHLGDEPVRLDAEDTAELLGAYGIHVLPSVHATGPEEARAAADEIGYPVALKLADGPLRHRTDLGGVRLDITSPQHLDAVLADMRRTLPAAADSFIVQAMAPPGVSTVLTMREDPSLGPVLAFSIAGDATSRLGDIAYGIPPLTPESALALIRRPAAAGKLFETIGGHRPDTPALQDLLVRAAALIHQHPSLAQVELNPVMVGADGVSVIDAAVTVQRTPNRLDSLRRTLLPSS